MLATVAVPKFSTALHGAGVIALGVAILRGAGLILRPHQQRWVQEQMDALAIRLADARPLLWTSRLLDNKYVGTIAWTIYIVCGSALLLSSRNIVSLRAISALWSITQPVAHLAEHAMVRVGINSANMSAQARATITILGALGLLVGQLGVRDVRLHPERMWLSPQLQGCSDLRTLRRRLRFFEFRLALVAVAVTLVSSVMLLPSLAALENLTLDPGGGGRQAALVVVEGLVLFLTACGWSMQASIACAHFVAVVMASIARLILSLARAVAWRIAEHDKGAWDGIVVILVMVLSVAAILVPK